MCQSDIPLVLGYGSIPETEDADHLPEFAVHTVPAIEQACVGNQSARKSRSSPDASVFLLR